MEKQEARIRSTGNITIPGSAGKPIVIDVHFKETGIPKAVVIFSHGFKGFKDWGHFDLVAANFAAQDLIFVKFNFSHNGTTPEDLLNFGDLEAFGNNNYIIELDDLALVIDWVTRAEELRGEVNAGAIYLLGHSRGGGISVLKAGEDQRVKKLATWASVSNFLNRNKKKTIDTWEKEGVVFAHNARTGQDMPLYRQFHEVMMANRERLNVLAAARGLEIPFLIVHGDSDEAVPFHEAEMLHRSAHSSTLLTIPGGSHTFGASHPFRQEQLPLQAQEVADQTIKFFKS